MRTHAHSPYTHAHSPYYGGSEGFETVLDLLEDASTGLLAAIQAEQQAAGAGGGKQQ